MFANIRSVLACSLKIGFLVYKLSAIHKRIVSLFSSVSSVVILARLFFVESFDISARMICRIVDILEPKKNYEMYFVWSKV